MKPDSDESEWGAGQGARAPPSGSSWAESRPVPSKGAPAGEGKQTLPHTGGCLAARRGHPHSVTARLPRHVTSGWKGDEREAQAQPPPGDSSKTSKATTAISS